MHTGKVNGHRVWVELRQVGNRGRSRQRLRPLGQQRKNLVERVPVDQVDQLAVEPGPINHHDVRTPQ